jgi:hypothetical protein
MLQLLVVVNVRSSLEIVHRPREIDGRETI